MIKEFCKVIGQEPQLATPNQERMSKMLSLFNDYLHIKMLTYHLILSRHIDDQRILQSDW